MANALQNPRGWYGGVSLDDVLWHQAIVTIQELEYTHSRDLAKTEDDNVLWSLLVTGLSDPTDNDGQWSTAIQSMRYSLAIGEHLWALIKKEKSRVGSLLFFLDM